jgi:hypothetical protein
MIHGNLCSQQQTIQNLIPNNIRSLVLSGPDYIGKHSFIQEYLKDHFESTDYLLVPEGIEGAREVREFFSHRSIFGSTRIAVINNLHRLNEPAQNVYLKLCEDTPSASRIIFVTSDIDSTISPLRSRFERIITWTTLNPAEMAVLFESEDALKINLCYGRPGLFGTINCSNFAELNITVQKMITGGMDSILCPIPTVICEHKNEYGPERDAISLVIKQAVHAIAINKEHIPGAIMFLKFAALLESIPSANILLHWHRICINLQSRCFDPCRN